ncbi:MAG: hypothetical protein ACREKL_05460 [Chthoniobacterales bacterium]
MARNPSRGSGGRRKADDPILLEHKKLLDEQEALLRKQEQARRVIEDAPRKLEKLKKRQREPIMISLKASRPGQKTFGGPHDKFSQAAGSPRRPRARKSERNIAKLQFIFLCAILAAIVLLIWRVIPQ